MLSKQVFGPLAAIALALSGCASTGLPPRGAAPGPALWQVSDNDTTIYLFGTVHLLPRDFSWFDSRIERALNSSDELVMEVDPADVGEAAGAMQAAGFLPEGQTLRGMMTGENRSDYEAALASLGLPAEVLDRMEPWAASLTLSVISLAREGFDAQSGVESLLNGKAGPDKKRDGLETVEEQLAIFDELTIETQLVLLEQTVEELPRFRAVLDAMLAAWMKGDAEQLAALVNAEITDPELSDRLLSSRNANWAGWIERRMTEPGTVFIAVGAGHLAGNGSVQDQLRKRGLKTRRVWQ